MAKSWIVLAAAARPQERCRRQAALSAAQRKALKALCARLGAQPVQHIGKVLILFRHKSGANSASGPDVQRECGSKTPPA